MTRLRWYLAPFAVALIALAMSCGGDKPNQSASADSPAGGGSSVSQELDLTSAANSLKDVRSFRIDVTLKIDTDSASGGDENDLGAAFLALLSNVHLQGAYVSPDSYEIQTTLLGKDLHAIQIGDQAWVNDGSGWTATDPAGDLGMLGQSPAELALGLLPQEVLSGATTSSEKVNGQDTTRYSFDKDSLAAVAARLGQDIGDLSEVDQMDLDVWMTGDNLPIKMTLKAQGEADGSKISVDVTANVTDLNDAGIKIEKPI